MLRQVSFLGLMLALTACSGGKKRSAAPPPPPVAISGSVAGLSGTGLVVRFNATSTVDVALNGNGAFTGPAFARGGTYKVTVRDQPTEPWQTCTVTNGTGTLTGPVSDVAINCTTNNYDVAFRVAGLTGANFKVQLNGGSAVRIWNDGAYGFGAELASGTNYTVGVHTQPDGQQCTIANPTGRIAGANILYVDITCAGNSFSYIVRDLPAWDLASNPLTGELYVITDSQAAGPGIAVINPLTGETVRTVPTPERASPLAISDDGQFLYAAMGTTGNIRRYVLPALTPDLEFSIGLDYTGQPLQPYDIRVAPGNAGTVAVTRNYTQGPNGQGLVIFDDGIARAATIGDATPAPGVHANGALWNADGTKIYSLSLVVGAPRFYESVVSAAGVTLQQEIPLPQERSYGFPVTTLPFVYGGYQMANDRLYTSTGAVFDPARRTQVGAFRTHGQGFTIDTTRNKVFFASGGILMPMIFESFDLARMTPVASHSVSMLPGQQGLVHRLVRWGADGLAAVTDTSKLFIVRGSFVSDTAGAAPVPVGNLVESTGAAGAHQYRVYGLPANDLLWDAARGRLYAAVDGQHGALGNSITAIDVNLNQVVGAAPVGSEPTRMSASDDGTRMYVTHYASSSVARVDLTTMQLHTVFLLNYPGQGPGYALAAEARPGDPSSFAFIEHYPAVDTLFTRMISGVTLLPMSFDERITTMAFADADTLFANNGWDSSRDLYQIGVVPTGLQLTERAPDPYDFGRMLRAAGLLYSDHGVAVSPATRAVEHSYDPGMSGTSKVFRANPARDRGYMAVEDSGGQVHLIVFRLGDEARLATVPLPPYMGSPISLTSMDDNGVAVCLDTGKTVIVQGPEL